MQTTLIYINEHNRLLLVIVMQCSCQFILLLYAQVICYVLCKLSIQKHNFVKTFKIVLNDNT